MMKRLLAGIFLAATTATAAITADDLSRYIAERAANCWATPAAMRGIRVDFAFDVRFSRDGHVDFVQIVDFEPESETSRLLAVDFAEALKSCGPYTTEGMRNMTLNVSWPM